MTTLAVQGGCLCGAVRFAVELPVLFCGHCHCSLCRRAHGAGYVTWIGVARERFSFLSGEKELTRYRSSEHGTRSFCRTCGSTLFCELATRPGVIDIVLANLDATSDIVPPRRRPSFARRTHRSRMPTVRPGIGPQSSTIW